MPRAANDVGDTARSIIATICRNSECIFRRLREASDRLADYDFLVRELPMLNVSTHPCYQRRYNSFYVVRRGNEWRTHYYGLLQRKKGEKVTFNEVIRELHRLTRRIEPSFSSKLVATIRPDFPAYDVEVCRHMNVFVPPRSIPQEDRISRLIIEYDRMINIANSAAKTAEFGKLSKNFDHEFQLYKDFTNTKKLDLMLWQCRDNDGSGGNA
jgi:hypothetical protein